MSISIDDVQSMAKLARLNLDDDTEKLFAKQFADIINYMNVLSEVDTENVQPLYSPATHNTPLRPDEAHAKCTRQDVLQNSPSQDEQYFVVPRIV